MPPGPSFVGCADIKRSQIGRTVLAKKPGSVSVAVAKKAVTLYPASPSSGMFLIRVDPQHLDRALQGWNEVYAGEDESLAIDGKTMCNAIDDQGHPTHVMSVIGHQTKICYTQKKLAPCP